MALSSAPGHSDPDTATNSVSDATANAGLDADVTIDDSKAFEAGDAIPPSSSPRDKETEVTETSAAVSPPSPTPSADKDAATKAADPEAGRSKVETILVMSALCLALFLAALDMTIVTTAIPTISHDFNSSSGYVWIGSAYLLGCAAFVTVWGKISDIFGRKPVLLSAVAVFWVGSLLCGVSVNMSMLIAARAIQGIGGGGIVVLPNICVSDLFSMRNRGMYFGILGMVWALASAIGPILGGVFTSEVTWRWCFYINLPLSGVGFVILLFVLKLHNPRTPIKQGLAAIDWLGSVLIIGGTIMLLVGLLFGGVDYPWDSATVICLIVFGFVTILLFVAYEWRFAKYPVMNMRIFRHQTSIAAATMAFFHAMTFMTGSYYLPLYFQSVIGADSLMSGVYLLPFVVSLSLVSTAAGIFIKKTGNYKLPINVSMAIMVLGFGLFIDLGSKTNWAKIVLYQIVAGIGVGPNFQAPLIALQTNVEPRDIGSATSSFAFMRQLGTAISVAIGGVIFNNEMNSQQAKLQRELGPELASRLSGETAAANVGYVGTLDGEDGDIARAAYWQALQTVFIAATCFAGVGFAIGLFIKQVKLKEQHTEHKTGLATLKKRGEADAEPEPKVVEKGEDTV